MLRFINKHIYSIIAVIVFHFAVLLYLNVKKIDLPPPFVKKTTVIEFDFTDNKEELPENIEELEKENITEQQFNERIKNAVRDVNDTREVADDNFSDQAIEQELMNKYKELEQNIYKENAAKRGGDKQTKLTEYTGNKKTEITPNETSKQGSDSDKKVGGKVTCECNVPNRKCKPKVPAYTCPKGGTIVVDVVVNQKGEVIEAEVNKSKSTSKNQCIADQAIKYAKRSWINQDFDGVKHQKGTITYNFLSQ